MIGDRRFFVRRLLRWGRANRRDFPWRRETEPWKVVVAEVLLQRSRAKTVAKVYDALFARWPDAASLATADLQEVKEVIRPVGLVGRADALVAIARAELDEGIGSTPDELMRIPGVGRYAANATTAVVHDRPAPVVDGVTARVYRRYFGVASDAPPVSDEALWELVAEVTPRSAARDWNWAVLDLAAAICTPKAPRCAGCPLRDRCAYPNT